MNYKDHYKELTSEAEIPFAAADTIQKGLRAKYGTDELDEYTFGIELEFTPASDDDPKYDWERINSDMYDNQSVRGEYDEHVTDERNRLNRNWRGNVDNWDDGYGPVDADTFKKYNPEPNSEDYTNEEDYETAYNTWKSQLKTVEREYNYWKNYEYYDKLEDFITGLDPFNYLDIDDYSIYGTFNIDTAIEDAMEYISMNMKQRVVKGANANGMQWAVGPDDKVIEIRSKHLKQNEFHLVAMICDYVEKHNTSGRTSAHVHIGLPNDFDEFDLLAMTTLVDEKAIKSTVGPERALDSFAKLRNSLHAAILNGISSRKGEKIDGAYFISNKNIDLSLNYIDRNHGTNINAMREHGTIEFRYLDSRIASRSPLFINWIKYFLLLPKIAKSKNKIVIKGNDSNLIAVRVAGGMKVYTDKKAPTINLPAADIKTAKPINTGKYIPKIQI